jgi:hypothetical protein
MATMMIRWNGEIKPDQLDAMFYCVGNGHYYVGTVIIDGKDYAQVYCDGEMRIRNGDDTATYCGELRDVGILTDKDLDRPESDDYEVIYNPWFDFYACADGEHMDLVCHTIPEVIANATELSVLLEPGATI